MKKTELKAKEGMDAQELTVRIYGDLCLREKSKPVRDIGPAERMLIASMLKTMYKNQGIGLAAPQVGINQQIFVADIGNGPLAVINPKITTKKGLASMEEGCLSIPEVQVVVKRAEHITFTYLDEWGNKQEKECSDLLARVVLHEYDHLQGTLIVDYANLMTRLKIKKQLDALKELSRQIAAG